MYSIITLNKSANTSLTEHLHFSEINGKKMLTDVVVLRLTLIFLLVWTHAFAPFVGSWSPIQGLENVVYPKWLVQIISYARMPGLVFISGYLLGYTTLRKSSALEFSSLVLKKIKRLIFPSLIFSLIYSLLFYEFNGNVYNYVYRIIDGAGHLWFLPMLFWCFCGIWILEKAKINPNIFLLFSILIAFVPFPIFPLRIDKTAHFFIYFFIGYSLQRGYLKLNFKKISLPNLLKLISIYFLIFILQYKYVSDYIIFERIASPYILNWGGNTLIVKVLHLVFVNIITLVLGLSGLLAVFFIAHSVIIPKVKIPSYLVMLSSYCYGVYIYHQFILIYMYYHTELIYFIPVDSVVWISFIFTIFLSLFFTHLTLRTKLGRHLIG